MNDKASFSAEAGSTAALFAVAGLAQVLGQKGLLNGDDLNAAFALAASMCRGNGNEDAAKVIELLAPSSAGFDPVAWAQQHGAETKRS